MLLLWEAFPKYNAIGDGWRGLRLIREEITTIIISIKLVPVSSWARQVHHTLFTSCPLVEEGSAERQENPGDGPRPSEGHRWLPHFCLASLEVKLWLWMGHSQARRAQIRRNKPKQMSFSKGKERFAGSSLSGWHPSSIAPLCGHLISDKWVGSSCCIYVQGL